MRWAACSIIKAVELPNSPATAKPCVKRAAKTAIGRKQTDRSVRRHDGHYAGADDHELNGERERGFAAGAIGVGAENNGSNRPGQVRQAE